MANGDPTRSILYAIRMLSPERPKMARGRRLVRFLMSVVIALLVVILAIDIMFALGAPKNISLVLVVSWMFVLCGGAPIVIALSIRDQDRFRRRIRDWESDSRRIAMERLGLDLTASRMPSGLRVNDLYSLDHASCDWLQSRDALDGLSWAQGELAATRDELRYQLDETMVNLLAESGAGHDLGPSPFVIERARALFVEVGAEAQTLAQTQSPAVRLTTDSSLESLRNGLDRLRDVRTARSHLVESLFQTITSDGL